MKSIVVNLIAAAALAVTTGAFAADMPAAGKSKCGTCHAEGKKLVGPSYKDIAAKYKDDKDAVEKIVASVKKGGKLGWKMGDMPAKGLGANDAEIKAMAEYIVSLSK